MLSSKMIIIQSVIKSIVLCSLVVFTFDAKTSQAAPSNGFSKHSRHSINTNSEYIGSLRRTRRSTNEEEPTSAPVEPRIRDLPW